MPLPDITCTPTAALAMGVQPVPYNSCATEGQV